MTGALGLDLSQYSGEPDFARVYGAGYRFTIFKATEGHDYVDPLFATNIARARAAGLRCGAYHFLRAGSPMEQAAHYLRTYLPAPGDLPELVDYEAVYDAAGNPVSLPGPGDLCGFLRAVNAARPAPPGKPSRKRIAYSNPSYIGATKLATMAPDVAELADLWLADWALSYWVPLPWTSCAIWQKGKAKAGTVPGIAADVDFDELELANLGDL